MRPRGCPRSYEATHQAPRGRRRADVELPRRRNLRRLRLRGRRGDSDGLRRLHPASLRPTKGWRIAARSRPNSAVRPACGPKLLLSFRLQGGRGRRGFAGRHTTFGGGTSDPPSPRRESRRAELAACTSVAKHTIAQGGSRAGATLDETPFRPDERAGGATTATCHPLTRLRRAESGRDARSPGCELGAPGGR